MIRRTLLVAIALVASLVVPAASATAEYGSGTLGSYSTYAHGIVGNPATADVLLVGDSITTRCYSHLSDALSAQGKTLAVNYWSGRPTTPAVDWLVAQPAVPPVVIMATGTNDIFTPYVMAAQVARVKAYLPAGTQLHWVDVHASRWGLDTDTQVSDQRNASWVDGQIRDQLQPEQVINWSYAIAATPGRGVSISRYLQDGIHPWPSAIDGHSDGCAFWTAVLMAGL